MIGARFTVTSLLLVALTACTGPSTDSGSIAKGPDGNYWIVASTADRVVRMTPSGASTFFSLTSGSGPSSITEGPDGNMWFTETARNQIGRISTAGTINEFPIPTSNAGPTDITSAGTDGLWFEESGTNKIGYVLTSGKVHDVQLAWPISSALVAGPNGEALVKAPGLLLRIKPSGQITALAIK